MSGTVLNTQDAAVSKAPHPLVASKSWDRQMSGKQVKYRMFAGEECPGEGKAKKGVGYTRVGCRPGSDFDKMTFEQSPIVIWKKHLGRGNSQCKGC